MRRLASSYRAERHHGPELAVGRGDDGRSSRHVVHESQLAETALLHVLADLLTAHDDVVPATSLTATTHSRHSSPAALKLVHTAPRQTRQNCLVCVASASAV